MQPLHTPLKQGRWQAALRDHPDKAWVRSLLKGLQEGFRIGLKPGTICSSSGRNSPSAHLHANVIRGYLQQQTQAGYMLGPYNPETCSGVVTSSLGVVPKSTPGKYRVIIDLSRPTGKSVNSQICRQWTHVVYSSVEDAALLMHSLGPGTLLAKIDIRNAYRIVPVHPSERVYLGLMWENKVYVDCQLPFGLASAPAIFSAVAEGLEWILRRRGVRAVLHYLDDFLLLGSPGSHECARALSITLATCEELGIPLAADKVVGPALSLSFLGIQLTSSPCQLSLPPEKMSSLRAQLQTLRDAHCVRSLESLQSLVGHLVHATKVCPLSKPFLSGLFQVLRSMSHGQVRRLNVAVRADLAWWTELLSSWSGVSTQQFTSLGKPDIHVYTDASGSWGCGAWVIPALNWFQTPWPAATALPSIALKELVPVVFAAAVWGPQWQGHFILCHSDNAAVVSQINSLHAHDPLACQMLRCLAIFQAHYDFHLRASHVAGIHNQGADHLSRGKVADFLALFPHNLPPPTQVPVDLQELLCSVPADWTSLNWRARFSTSWKQGWQSQPEKHIRPPGGATVHSQGSLASPPGQ